eukprot:5832176-Amphidinium_carterae.1
MSCEMITFRCMKIQPNTIVKHTMKSYSLRDCLVTEILVVRFWNSWGGDVHYARRINGRATLERTSW